MKDSEFENMLKLEDEYWWFKGRRYIIQNLMKTLDPVDRILDVGAGIGSNAGMLSGFGQLTSIDNSKKAIGMAKDRGVEIVQADAQNLPFFGEAFDLVTAFDLLEHIEDDAKALAEKFRVLKPGGYLLISVPAYQFLWSEHDKALGHKRRYTKKGLEKKIKNSGFKIIKKTHAVSLSLPAILIYRILTKNRKREEVTYVILPKIVNHFLTNLLKLEAKIIEKVSLPAGASIFILARK